MGVSFPDLFQEGALMILLGILIYRYHFKLCGYGFHFFPMQSYEDFS